MRDFKELRNAQLVLCEFINAQNTHPFLCMAPHYKCCVGNVVAVGDKNKLAKVIATADTYEHTADLVNLLMNFINDSLTDGSFTIPRIEKFYIPMDVYDEEYDTKEEERKPE